MRHQDIATLRATGTVLQAGATRSQLLEHVAKTIEAIGPSTFSTLTNVEGQALPVLRQKSIAGTALEPVALAAALTTGGDQATTVGGLMDALSLSQADVNSLACHCANGDEMTATRAASNLRALAAKK